jgi:hypothetical protein
MEGASGFAGASCLGPASLLVALNESIIGLVEREHGLDLVVL